MREREKEGKRKTGVRGKGHNETTILLRAHSVNIYSGSCGLSAHKCP